MSLTMCCISSTINKHPLLSCFCLLQHLQYCWAAFVKNEQRKYFLLVLYIFPLPAGLGVPSSPCRKCVKVCVAAHAHPPYTPVFWVWYSVGTASVSCSLPSFFSFWLYLFSQQRCFGWGSSLLPSPLYSGLACIFTHVSKQVCILLVCVQTLDQHVVEKHE